MAGVQCRRLLIGRLFASQARCVTNFQHYPKQPLYVNCSCTKLLPTTSISSPLIPGSLFRNISNKTSNDTPEEPPKLTLVQRFKQMYRDYWYVLVPVHLVTSAGWYGGFYYLAKSGIDIIALLESWNFSETVLSPLRDSSMGYLAVAYFLYKLATPFRYTVTLGGTTVSISYLRRWGMIKPVPSKEKLREMYQERKDNLLHTVKDKRNELNMKKNHLRDRTGHILTKIKDTKGGVLPELGKDLKK